MEAVEKIDEMLAGMAPRLDGRMYVFCTTDDPAHMAEAVTRCVGSFREAEGLSLILAEGDARELGFGVAAPMCQITLGVHSSLEGVGLTAAVSGALAREGIPCNIVAAFHHDHAFVPASRAADAMRSLEALAGCGGGVTGND